MPPQTEEGFYSSLGIKVHPSRGDHVFISGDDWLKEKGHNDGAEGLWRVHDDLYDFTDFVDRHPGGSMWLQLTKGTDITEAFETHHISVGPGKMLSKFQVRKATTPRNSPFTFEDDGFYRQLKKEIREYLPNIPKSASRKSNIIIDCLLLAFLTSAVLSAKFWNYYIGALAGVFLAMLTVAAHNYFHQKDSFRMYYFDFSLMSSREWRISHVLSHHLYTNTIIDLELQLFEPLLPFLPVKKPFIIKYFSFLYAPLLFMSIFGIVFGRRLLALGKGEFSAVGKRIFIPFIAPTLMYIFGGQTLGTTLTLWLWTIGIASLQFIFIGVNAAHQRTDIFHDGDTPRGKTIDWGISQLDAVMDRTDITGSHFLVLTNFGDHGLHHLFPTLDHGKLAYLYPVFEKVCNQFGVRLRKTTQLDMVLGTFKSIANETPNPFPPGHKEN